MFQPAMPIETDTFEPEPLRDSALGPLLEQALEQKGYKQLTQVQEQVLDPALMGRDLRISSQTGSGKTLAIGFVLRDVVQRHCERRRDVARGKLLGPAAIVVVPTRELAKQVHQELSWLYAPMKVNVTSVAGGASYRDEHRALARDPAIVVGTPGRMVDHLSRGGVLTEGVGVVVLDEADQMLDLGFREDLDAILEKLPANRRTHLVSATFPRDVVALADRVQTNPKRVEGTPLGSANTDIDHVVHLIDPREKVAALVNVLLANPNDQTLIFARTRADVGDLSRELQAAGFMVGALSGDMAQAARNQALSAFKRGELRALVATDVAARGIDVQNIARVVQLDAPTHPETYTHRSGRTGRAGRKGSSVLLIPRSALNRTNMVLSRAGVRHRVDPIPTPELIGSAQDTRWLAELEAAEENVSPRVRALLEKITAGGHTERALASLLKTMLEARGVPRPVTVISANGPGRPPMGTSNAGANNRTPFTRGKPSSAASRTSWVAFRVSFGMSHGADPRKLVAMLCRRGGITGGDIGSIRVDKLFSEVEVAETVAESFAKATRDRDPRDPRIHIERAAASVSPRRKPYEVTARKEAPRDARPQRPFTKPRRMPKPNESF
jgi:ATP-dependent RNA helicase DeaD